jgi:methanogenic corrinoid protein MtbC1
MAEGTLAELKRAILRYDVEAAQRWARQSVQEGIDPLESIDAMTAAIREVGDGFGRGDLWLPDLIGAANAMKHSAPIIEEEIRRAGLSRPSAGSVVIGTVFGDIHDIGKNMVITLLTADGFTVHDVGVNATAEELIAAVERHEPDILAMSALMTMTSLEQSNTIEGLEKAGLRERVKVMVGGAAITQSFADDIGADGYDASATGAVTLAQRLMGTNAEDPSECR